MIVFFEEFEEGENNIVFILKEEKGRIGMCKNKNGGGPGEGKWTESLREEERDGKGEKPKKSGCPVIHTRTLYISFSIFPKKKHLLLSRFLVKLFITFYYFKCFCAKSHVFFTRPFWVF